MKLAGWALVLAGGLLAIAPARAQLPAQDQGVFTVSKQGRRLGIERFSLRHDASGTRLEIELDYGIEGKSVRQQASLRLGPRDALDSYRWREGAESITVAYNHGRVVARYQAAKGPGSDYRFQMPADTGIVDQDIFSLWEVLAARYDRAKGGIQKFTVFVPHSGDPSRITMSAVRAPHALKGELNLHVTTDQGALDMTLQGGKFVSGSVPAAQVEIQRTSGRQR